MKVMQTFGVDFFGQHAVLKMNGKINKEQKMLLEEEWGWTLNIYSVRSRTGRELVRIEGVVRADDYHFFKNELDKAILASKLEEMQMEMEILQSRVRAPFKHQAEEGTEVRCQIDPLDDLPF